MAAPLVNDGRIFFVYDHLAQQREEDDPADSIVYFYPLMTNQTQQCELCGQLMGVGGLLRNLFSPDEPSVVTLTTDKFAIRHANTYSLVLSSSLSMPDEILVNQLEALYDMFAFYQGSIEKVMMLCNNNRSSFLKEMSIIWDSYLLYVRCYDDELAMVFRRIPTVSLPKTSASLFLRASHVLQVHRRRPGVLGGCILYNNEVLMTQLSPDLTYRLCIIRPHQKHLPCQQVVTSLVFPIGVRILVVYLSQSEYKQIKPTSDSQVMWSSCSSNFEDDSLFVLQRRLSHRVGSKSSMGSESDINIDTLMGEGEEEPKTEDSLAEFERAVDALETIEEAGPKSGSSTSDLAEDGRPLAVSPRTRSHSVPEILSMDNEGSRPTMRLVPEESSTSTESQLHKAKSCNACDRLTNGRCAISNSPTLQISESLASIRDVATVRTGTISNGDSRPTVGDSKEGKSLKLTSKLNHSIGRLRNELSVRDSGEGLSSLPNGDIPNRGVEVPGRHLETRDGCISSVNREAMSLGSAIETGEDESAISGGKDLIVGQVINSEQSGVVSEVSVERESEDEVAAVRNTVKFNDTDNSEERPDHEGGKTDNSEERSDANLESTDNPEQRPDPESRERESPEFVDASAATPVGSPCEPKEYEMNFAKMAEKVGELGTMAEGSVEEKADDINTDSGQELGKQQKQEQQKRKRKRKRKVVLTSPQEEVKLYIQGHSNIVLLLLIEPFVDDEAELLHTLWKTSLEHLGDLEANIKECLINENRPGPNAAYAYSYLQYDRFERDVQGDTQPCSSREIQFTETAIQIHEEFRRSPSMTNITLRSHSNTVFGHQNPTREVFFQSNLPSKIQLEASAPLMNNTMNVIKKQATRTLLENHDIKLL